MSRRFLPLLLLLQTPAAAQLPAPLPYVQNLEVLDGKRLVLKQVRCDATGKPQTLARLYLSERPDGRYEAARLEYNAQGKAILDRMNGGKGAQYFDKYVTQHQPLNLTTFNALLGLWRVFGTKFDLDGTVYRCQVF